MTLLAELQVGGDTEPWRAIGLHIVDDRAVVGGVRLRFVGEEPGLRGWTLADLPRSFVGGLIDGVPTATGEAPGSLGEGHLLHVLGTDHVVVNTSSLERTCGAIEAATGAPLKRIREAGAIRQGFHRWGGVIVEVVESPQITATVASLWGLVWVVSDLDEVCSRLGSELLSAPRSAVQQGRSIASFRSAAGLGVPVALMTGDPRAGGSRP